MKKNYINSILLLLMLAVSLTASAQDGLTAPKGNTLESGKQYTLFNYYTPASYLGRTTWDGALINWGASADNYLKFYAIENENSTWSFYYDTVDADSAAVRYYMNIPSGTANVNINATSAAEWQVSQKDGFYRFVVGTGTNADAVGYNMHMNSGCAYIVASYPGNSWYPDFYGGKLVDAEGNEVYDANDNLIMADSLSCNWILVEVDNVADYIVTATGYQTIRDFYNTYIADEPYADYQTGFTATYNAALAIYNGAEFFEEDVETVQAMVDAKVALYKQIEAAKALENPDAVLEGAISNATDIFNGTTDASTVTSATETLAKAVENFQLGAGDITSLGKNMSFEDLSAQNGNMTTGIGAPPAGWHVYINSAEVTTADEVKAAGIANWHGVNDDSEGEGKDGNYAYGIWTSSIPTFEVSQTIEGLENGTYTITAGLMVGANGNGSRRTTQRIFGNLNSTYYASEEEYNQTQLDQSEVYAFQGLVEPVTDRELKLVTVNAYVYDGTLTFGLRTDGNIAAANRTSGNSAGGDGWFKVDNFKITYNGYDADNALSIVNFFKQKLADMNDNSEIRLPESVRTNVETLVAAADELTSESAVEDINKSILDMSENITGVTNIANAYTSLGDAITTAYERAEEVQNYAGAGVFVDSILYVEDKWYNAEYETVEEINAAIAALDAYYQACLESDPIEEGSDLTSYIVNNSFEDLSNQNNSTSTGIANAPKGWTLVMDGNEVSTATEIGAAGITNWCAINGGDNINVEFDGEVYTHQYTDGEYLWGVWSASVPEIELSQTLSLPQGVYELTCDMMVQHDWSGNCISTQRLFGNASVQMWARESDYADNLTNDALYAKALQDYNTDETVTYYSYAGYDNDVQGEYSSLLRPMKLTFVVGADKVAKVGIRTNKNSAVVADHNGLGWFKVDNFHLTCVKLGEYTLPELPDAIEDVKSETNPSNSDIYDLAGRKVSAPVKGIYIKNGKKFLVK